MCYTHSTFPRDQIADVRAEHDEGTERGRNDSVRSPRVRPAAERVQSERYHHS